MLPLHNIILRLLLQPPRLLILLVLLRPLLLMQLNQVHLLLVLRLRPQLSIDQPTPVVHRALPLHEEVEMIVVQMEKFLTLTREPQSHQ